MAPKNLIAIMCYIDEREEEKKNANQIKMKKNALKNFNAIEIREDRQFNG